MEVQTRNEAGALQFFDSLRLAFNHAEKDMSVWKVSFNAEDGSRVRLIRCWDEQQGKDCWSFEPLLPTDIPPPLVDQDEPDDNEGDTRGGKPAGGYEFPRASSVTAGFVMHEDPIPPGKTERLSKG